ncbi:MAG: hypothetical protein M3R51_02115 [Candidatus Eremiobacteraeota bacterium]|nr:hypothetical protein [Candidatus Eremiobacteraeota bacterium]
MSQQQTDTTPAVAGRPQYIYVGDMDSQIRVFKATATGNVLPVRVITGSNTQLIYPSWLFTGTTGDLWVSNYANPGGNIEAFPLTASGNATPIIDISGTKTNVSAEAGLYRDSHGGIISADTANTSVNFFAPGSNGNVAPVRIIAGSSTQLSVPNGIWIDPTTKNVFVASFGNNSILAFNPAANGNVAPLYEIAGSNTTVCQPTGIVFDAKGLLYEVNSDYGGGCVPSILVFAAGAKGNVAPIRSIVGSKTRLNTPYSIRVDKLGYIYVTDSLANDVKVYPPGAHGNVAPVQDITNVSHPNGLATH